MPSISKDLINPAGTKNTLGVFFLSVPITIFNIIINKII